MANITNELVKFNQSKSSSQALTGDASTIHFTTDGDLVLNGKSYIHTIGAATKNTDGTYTITGGALKQVSDAIGGETGLGGRVVALEQKVDGYTPEGGTAVPGLLADVATLKGADTVDGSVKKQIKDAIGGLDVTETETVGSVVVAVSETDGKVSSTRQTLSVVKVADEAKAEGMSAEYQIKIGEHALDTKISIPYAGSVLTNAVLSDMNATVNAETGVITPGDPKGADALLMVFQKADGTYVGVKTDISKILVESEFKNGLDVSINGEVSVKFGTNNAYLGFGNETTGNKSVQAKIVSIANASSTSTGLVDANDAKTEISAVKTIADAKIASVKQSEEGQEVTVTTVTTKVEDVVSSVDVTIGVSKATYEGTDEKTLSDAGLVDGATVKAFVADKVSKGSIQSVSGETDSEGTTTALVTATTSDAKAVTIASSQKLKDAVSKAETSIQGVTGESSTATYTPLVAVSQKDANNAVVVSATEKLQTAVSKAEGSIQSVTGESDPEGTTTPTALITASTNQDNEVTITASNRLKNTINAMYWS